MCCLLVGLLTGVWATYEASFLKTTAFPSSHHCLLLSARVEPRELAIHAGSWLSWSCTDLEWTATVAVSPWVRWPCHVQKTVLHNIACFQSSPLVCHISGLFCGWLIAHCTDKHYILLPYFSWRTFELFLSFDFMNDSACVFVWICFNFSWIMYLE